MKLIILITTITIVSILAFIISKKMDSYSDIPLLTGPIMVINIVVMVAFLIAIPVCQYDTRLSIEHFKSTKATIKYQRQNATDLEKVKLSEIIIDCNAWLSKEQYSCKSKWVGIYSNKSVLKLTPIE